MNKKKQVGNYIIHADGSTPVKWVKKYKEWAKVKIGYSGNPSYQYKTFSFNGESRSYLHRVIWEAFYGPIPKGLVVDHIDGDRMNNSIDNLQLLTRAANSRKSMIASWSKGSLSVAQKVICNETGKVYNHINDLAKELNMKSDYIYKHLRGVAKNVRGKTYRYG